MRPLSTGRLMERRGGLAGEDVVGRHRHADALLVRPIGQEEEEEGLSLLSVDVLSEADRARVRPHLQIGDHAVGAQSRRYSLQLKLGNT